MKDRISRSSLFAAVRHPLRTPSGCNRVGRRAALSSAPAGRQAYCSCVRVDGRHAAGDGLARLWGFLRGRCASAAYWRSGSDESKWCGRSKARLFGSDLVLFMRPGWAHSVTRGRRCRLPLSHAAPRHGRRHRCATWCAGAAGRPFGKGRRDRSLPDIGHYLDRQSCPYRTGIRTCEIIGQKPGGP